MIWLKILGPMILVGALFGAGWWEGDKAWKKKYATLEATYQVERARWDARINWINGEGRAQDERSTKEFRDEIDVSRKQLSAVREQLRRERAARAALKPAGDAPATCRAFAAPPTQLSEQDADFLTGEAERANEVVAERNTCVRKYNEMKAIIDSFKGE